VFQAAAAQCLQGHGVSGQLRRESERLEAGIEEWEAPSLATTESCLGLEDGGGTGGGPRIGHNHRIADRPDLRFTLRLRAWGLSTLTRALEGSRHRGAQHSHSTAPYCSHSLCRHKVQDARCTEYTCMLDAQRPYVYILPIPATE